MEREREREKEMSILFVNELIIALFGFVGLGFVISFEIGVSDF